MSRRDRSPTQRRSHRERQRERRVKRFAELPRAPARLNFFGFGRMGDTAKLRLDFTGPAIPLDPEDLASGNPANALRLAQLRQQWTETGCVTRGEG